MMKVRILFLFILTALFSPLPTQGKEAWTRVSSKNFQIVGNTSEKELRGAALKLENFRESFRQLFPRINFNSGAQTNVVVFNKDAAFASFQQSKNAGNFNYFQSGEDVDYIALSLENESLENVFHNYVHSLIENYVGRARVPAWLDEGLAEYFETFRLDENNRVVSGDLQNRHLQLFKSHKLIPLEKLFGIDYQSLRAQGEHGKSLFYAESWALVYFFQHANNRARSEQFNKFLALLTQENQLRAAFQEAFQVDYAAIEKELKDYFEQSQSTEKLTVKETLIAAWQMQATPVSEAEANAFLGDLLLHINRSDEAVKHLQKTLALDDKSFLANAALGMTFVKQRKFAEARKHLEKAVALAPQNYLAHYYYAYAISRENMDATGFVDSYEPEKIEKMRKALKKSIELNPDFAESYRLLSLVHFVGNKDATEAFVWQRRAVALKPGNPWYAFELANIYVRLEEYETARVNAEKIFASAVDKDLQTKSHALVLSLRRIQEQLKWISQNPGIGNPPQIPMEEALLMSLNEALRKPQKDEKRVLGHLTQIECGEKDVNLVVRSEEPNSKSVVKFSVADLQKIRMTAFVPDFAGNEVTCGARNPEDFVVVTYRKADAASTETLGEVVALEFVPKIFRFKP